MSKSKNTSDRSITAHYANDRIAPIAVIPEGRNMLCTYDVGDDFRIRSRGSICAPDIRRVRSDSNLPEL
jgi:hypothetical protein